MKEFRKHPVAVAVIATFSLAFAANGSDNAAHSAEESAPAKVAGALSGNPYATEQLLGDGEITKDEYPLVPATGRVEGVNYDTHDLEIVGGVVRQGRGGERDSDDPSLAPGMFNEFLRAGMAAEIGGFTGTRSRRYKADIMETEWVSAYTTKTASGFRAEDYVDFGYWLIEFPGEMGGTEYFLHTFARTSMPSGNVSRVMGSATYSGSATGLYVKKAGGAPESSGQFIADASLLANFGGDDVAENDQFEISGSIFNFRDDHGYVIDAAWAVTLGGADIQGADGTTTLGMTTGGGSWKAQFGGSTGSDQYRMPGSVVGTFDAHLGNGHIGGAFAAHRQVALAEEGDPMKVAAALTADGPTEQLLGDAEITKDEYPIIPSTGRVEGVNYDTHDLVFDAGLVRQGRGQMRDADDPSLAAGMPNEFTLEGMVSEIAGFTGSRSMREVQDLSETHWVAIYTNKTAEGDTASDYLDFGYWLLDYPDDSGEIHYFLHTFARASMPSGNVSLVTGSASYQGSATGLYAKKVDGAPQSSGQFVADVALLANFGGDDVAENDQFEISGSISNFKNRHGEMIDSSWTVILGGASIDRTDGTSDLAGTTGGGKWKAQFAGSTGLRNAMMPDSVVGTFDAHLTNGHVGGAFAAHIQD